MKEQDTKVNFNMAQGLSMELLNLRQKANYNLIKGNLKTLFNCLKAIKCSVIASISKSEREILRGLEIDIVTQLEIMNMNSGGFAISSKYETARTKASLKIEDYNEMLMDILQKRGFLMGEKSDASKLAGVS